MEPLGDLNPQLALDSIVLMLALIALVAAVIEALPLGEPTIPPSPLSVPHRIRCFSRPRNTRSTHRLCWISTP